MYLGEEDIAQFLFIQLLLGKIAMPHLDLSLTQFLYTSLFILFFHVPLNYILFEIVSLAGIIALIFHFYPLPNPFLFYVANHNCLYALEISILIDFGMNFISAKIGSDCMTAMYVLDFA